MNGETTITGYLPFINVGDNLNLDGKFLEHKVYGEQFVVDTFEKTMPETTDAIERYLSNGVIKGLGKATAKKIVKEFGEDTINVIKSPAVLLNNRIKLIRFTHLFQNTGLMIGSFFRILSAVNVHVHL